MISSYDWAGGREAMIRLGPDHGPVAIVALPLFEEANRTRTFAVTMMRALAQRGIASVLPDLPGTGESLTPVEHATLADWRTAYAAAARTVGAGFSLAVRSGALIDTAADLECRWQLAPQDGAALIRELDRVRHAARAEYDGDIVCIAGNRLSRDLLEEIGAAGTAARARTVRLASDTAHADLSIEASPLWRRAEPDNDNALAQRLADDIGDWIAAYAA